MVASIVSGRSNDDPRKLSAMISRVSSLASEHAVASVVVGLAAEEGDLVFPEYVNFLASALRVEDGIFRMTRERAVLHLVDVDATRADDVLERLTMDFCDEFPVQSRPEFQMRMLEVKPGSAGLRVKDVLTQIFAERVLH
jgi:hypothetical protein